MKERRIVELAGDFERYVREGLQKFPLNEHLLAMEAEYRQVVDQYGAAEMALRKAFSANPRQDWIAIRLAKTLEHTGKREEARDVLIKCLQENPTSKKAHFELAMLYMEHGSSADRDLIFDHLRRSFTIGDHNYEAQFWYAREAFMMGDYAEAKTVFQSLRAAQMSPELKTRIRAVISEQTGGARVYVGEIIAIEDVYMFVKCLDFPDNIFVHRSRTADERWDQFRRGTKVTMTVGFTMRGVTGAAVQKLN